MFNKDLLIKAMNDKNITAYRLWKDSNVAQSTISNILNGSNTNPKMATLEKLANTLEVPVSDFFDKKDIHTNNASIEEEFDEETRAIARDMKNLSSRKKKLLRDLIKTMSESADKELNK